MADSYVTVGTIQQVMLDGAGKVSEVLVTPTTDFTLKFGKVSYFILLPVDTHGKVDETTGAKFKRLEDSRFTVDDPLGSTLTQAAIARTVVEIRCESRTGLDAKVVSIKIPASA